MEDKEERILISELRKYKGDMYKLTMFGDKDVLPVERVWQMCMTKQDAIERIKKSLKSIQCWPDSFNDTISEVALNALLEGVKK